MPSDSPPPPSGPPSPPGPQGSPGPYDPYRPPYETTPTYGRRKSNTTVIVVIALAAVVAAALITAALVLKPPGKHDDLARPGRPLLIQQVIAASTGGCADGADGAGVPSLDGATCYQLASGLTVTQFEAVDVVTSGTGSWAIRIYLLPPDAVVFERLTTRVYQESPPRNQLALVVDGKVISSPAVQGPIAGGKVQIEGNFTRDAAKHIADQLDG